MSRKLSGGCASCALAPIARGRAFPRLDLPDLRVVFRKLVQSFRVVMICGADGQPRELCKLVDP